MATATNAAHAMTPKCKSARWSMRTKAIGPWLLACASAAAAGDAPFTGVFMGGGRACYGGLFVRARTVEWNTPFNRCKRARYALLESKLTPGHERVAMRLKNPSCAFQVIALEQTQEWAGRRMATRRSKPMKSVNGRTGRTRQSRAAWC